MTGWEINSKGNSARDINFTLLRSGIYKKENLCQNIGRIKFSGILRYKPIANSDQKVRLSIYLQDKKNESSRGFCYTSGVQSVAKRKQKD